MHARLRWCGWLISSATPAVSNYRSESLVQVLADVWVGNGDKSLATGPIGSKFTRCAPVISILAPGELIVRPGDSGSGSLPRRPDARPPTCSPRG